MRHSLPKEIEETGQKKKVLIETRAEGGYFLIEPSNGYNILKGDLMDIPVLTSQEQDVLIESARSLNQLKLSEKSTHIKLLVGYMMQECLQKQA